jgi:hypothetical protein
MFSTAPIFSGFGSIPPCETRKPSSFRLETQKPHFSGLSIMRLERNLLKT